LIQIIKISLTSIATVALLVTISPVAAQSLFDLIQQAKTRELVYGDRAGAIETYRQIIDAGVRNDPDAAAVERARELLAELTQSEIFIPYTKDPTSFAFSPDGSRLVYAAVAGGMGQLWLYDLESGNHSPIPGATLVDPIYTALFWPAARPFWSPDGQAIGYFSGGKLKVIDADGGTPRTLTPAPVPRGATWSVDDQIVYATTSGVFTIPADGSEAARNLEIEGGMCPHFLPDGQTFMVFRNNGPFIWTHSLNDTELELSAFRAFSAQIIDPDLLLYIDGGDLLLQSIDVDALQPTGASRKLADAIDGLPNNACLRGASAARSGAVAYRQIRPLLTPHRHIVLMDRSGNEIEARDNDQRLACCARVSTDGTRLLISRNGATNGSLWITDLSESGSEQHVLDGSYVGVFTPDANALITAIFSNSGPAGPGYYLELVSLDGSDRRRLSVSPGARVVDLAPDGDLILYEDTVSYDLYALSVDLDSDYDMPDSGETLPSVQPIPVATTDAVEQRGRFSPDSEWVAFQSDDAKERFEIFVQPLLTGDPEARVRVSTNGGTAPVWRADGRELFFLSPEFEVMSVSIAFSESGSLVAGEPVTLFQVPRGSEFDVADNGETFVINENLDTHEDWPITILTDLTAGI
jgi:Tol biopolymer transport system component